MDNSTFIISLISGACAGTSTDLAFFPIDTIKTRLQAKGGFFANGGYHGIYRGLGSCVVASAPSASLFFITYDSMKIYTKQYIDSPVQRHMISSSCGEIAACLVRVPAEVIKQRTQTGRVGHNGVSSSWSNFMYLIKDKSGEGLIRGLYRGWNTTIMREIPFTVIQFPLYEWLKEKWAKTTHSAEKLSAVKGAICGSIAGGVAAALTTPLDVIKTRIMLHKDRVNVVDVVKSIIREEGLGTFLNGIGPRTAWISAGGAIFLGCYELVHASLSYSKEEKLQ
ncbi:mitochondrial carrier protein PET8 [Spathaspora passalidarum NRRL Y-27907]|uniref:Mitochondrial thiamine pyrophosphate carrier 1 n=1 Tax=Spathaspora passalidarum (strain NRRL Y-27907 / 11-Y1) TaxID=619300 RepID=G3AVN7_SPAPN|nr:mitochondrial carrier protein PET8 [Spathaspora passalidarum NRRL Y-27907]EGW30203.1 mitochondrial carrier protein PET8 [Spathaspora passalidarum NRRL Y-27907]